MPEETARTDQPSRGRKPIWASKIMLGAIALTIAGLGLWVYSMATKPEPVAARSLSVPLSGFAAGGSPGATQPPPAPPESRLIDDASPAMFRLGAGFLGGFFLAWAFKKFIKITALMLGFGALVIFGLHKAGVIDVTSSKELQDQLEQGAEWAGEQAGAAKQFLTGYIPSGVSSAAGLLYGLRKA